MNMKLRTKEQSKRYDKLRQLVLEREAEQTRHMFDRLRKGGRDAYLWQRLSETQKRTIWVGPDTDVVALSLKKPNVYWSVHSGLAARKTAGNRMTNAEITHCNVLYGDLDFKAYGGGRQAALDHVHELAAGPNAVVASGGGLHLYWFLAETVVLTTEEERRRFAAIQAAWVNLVGADPGAKDLARVLRVPGSVNAKYVPPTPVELIEYQEEGSWPLEELIELLPKRWETTEADKPMGPLPTPELGDAHTWLRNEAARMVVRGDPDEVIMAVLRTVNEQQGVGIDEERLRRFVASARKKFWPGQTDKEESAHSYSGGKYDQNSKDGSDDGEDAGGTPGGPAPAGAASGGRPLGFEHLDDAIRLHGLLKGRAWRDRSARAWYTFDEQQGVWRSGGVAAGLVRDGLRGVRDLLATEVATVANQNRKKAIYAHLHHKLRNEIWMSHVVSEYSGFVEINLELSGIRFDDHPELVKVANGTVELTTGALREDRLEDYLTQRCPTPYTPGAVNSEWEAHVAWMMEDDPELVAFMRRLAGYCLLGGNKEQVFPILHGWGGNGKGTYCELLKRVMGDELACGPDKSIVMAHPKNDWTDLEHPLAALIGKRYAWISEPQDGDVLRQDRVKELTGGNIVVGRLKYANAVQFQNTAVLVLDTNHYPLIPTWDAAIRRRLLVIEGKRTFDKLDKDRKDRILRASPEGILAWMVRGATEVLADGLRPPERIKEWTEAFTETEDWRKIFLEEVTLQVPGSKAEAGRESCTLSELYGALRVWWKDNSSAGASPTKRTLAQVLQAFGYDPQYSMKVTSNSNQVKRVVAGLKLREEWYSRAVTANEWNG